MGSIGHNLPPRANNWIAVDRDVRFHPIVGFLDEAGKPRKGVVVCEMVAWLDLVMEANWKDRQANNKGKVMVIERGQLMAARSWLAQRWGWSQDKVRWFFKKLEEDGMISFPAPKITQAVLSNRTQSNPQKRAHFANVITICNYNTYQAACELDALLSTPSNTQSTPNQHPYLNKETNKQTQTEAHASGQSDTAWPNGDFVHANGEAIHVSLLGRRVKFDYCAIDQWAALGMCKPEIARQIVEAEALGWVADQKWPNAPSRWLQAQISKWRVHKAVAETRIANEQARAPQRSKVASASCGNDRPQTWQEKQDAAYNYLLRK